MLEMLSFDVFNGETMLGLLRITRGGESTMFLFTSSGTALAVGRSDVASLTTATGIGLVGCFTAFPFGMNADGGRNAFGVTPILLKCSRYFVRFQVVLTNDTRFRILVLKDVPLKP